MVFVIFSLFILLLYKFRIPYNKVFSIFIVLIVSLVCAHRSLSVPDTEPYLNIYMGYVVGSYEKGYIYLCDFFRNLGFSFTSFLFVISFLGLTIWFSITKNIVSKKHMLLAFVIYLSYMGIYYHGIVLRACFAILINYIGIYWGLLKEKNYLIYYLCVLISIFFHISSILFALLPFIITRKYSKMVLYGVLIFSFLFMLLNKNLTIITNLLTTAMEHLSILGASRLEGYIEDVSKSTLSLNHIKYLLSGLALVFFSNDKYFIGQDSKNFNTFLNIYVIGIVLMFLLSFAPGSGRISQLFLFFEFMPIILLYESIAKSKKIYLQLFIVVLILTNFISLFNLAPAVLHYCS